MLALVLMILALVLFVMSALNVPSTKIDLTAAGLACVAAAWLAVRFG